MRHFFYDTETGGCTPKQSLLTFYGVVTDENFDVLDEISFALKPADGIYRIQIEALRVNQINLVEHDKVAISMEHGKVKLRDFLVKNSCYGVHKLHPAGWNIYWDNAIVQKQLLEDFDDFFSRHCLDVAGIAVLLKTMGKLPEGLKLSLSTLAEHYGVNFLTQAHDAKSDVGVTISVLKCMLRDLKPQKL